MNRIFLACKLHLGFLTTYLYVGSGYNELYCTSIFFVPSSMYGQGKSVFYVVHWILFLEMI